NYGYLALDGNGGSTLRDTIAQGGAKTLYKVGDKTDTEPGQVTGPVQQGLSDWAASHNDQMGSSCDDWDSSHTFVDGKLQVSATCPSRVGPTPTTDQWPTGKKSVPILGFAKMYLAGFTNSSSSSGSSSCSSSGVTTGGAASGSAWRVLPDRRYAPLENPGNGN